MRPPLQASPACDGGSGLGDGVGVFAQGLPAKQMNEGQPGLIIAGEVMLPEQAGSSGEAMIFDFFALPADVRGC